MPGQGGCVVGGDSFRPDRARPDAGSGEVMASGRVQVERRALDRCRTLGIVAGFWIASAFGIGSVRDWLGS